MITYIWTKHAEWKMNYYGLSKQKVLGVVCRPDRVERGIAGVRTVAAMRIVSPKTVNGKRVWKQEIWTMYQSVRKLNEKRIISVWRYPGMSSQNSPIPEEIFQEMENIGKCIHK